MVTLVLVKNPFAPQDGREVRHIEAVCTLAELLEENRMEGVDLLATVNGYSVDSATKLKDGDFVVIYPEIAKGGGKGGKGILGIIAAVALSVVSFGIASSGWLASSGFWAAGHLGAYMAATAVMFLGSTLIGRFMGQQVDNGSYGEKEDPTYSWGQVQTMEGQNNPIALTYGKVKSGGQTIGKYVSIDDSDEYLNWLVAAGEGPLTISDIKLNDNDIENFDKVKYEIRDGENDQTMISYFNDTYATKNVSYKLGENWTEDSANGADTRGLVLEVDFPNGLFHYTDSGNVEEASVQLDIEYKNLSAGNNWTNFFTDVEANLYGVSMDKDIKAGDYTLTLSGIFYGDDDYEYLGRVRIGIGDASTTISVRNGEISKNTVTVGSFQVQPAQWDNSILDQIGNGETVTATITVATGKAGSGIVTGKQTSALRKQFRLNKLPAGEYAIRAKVVSRQYEEDDVKAKSDCYLTAITSVVYDDFVYPCTALVGIRALATDQLNGSPNLTFMKERKKVWVWTGSKYVERLANNPAWACYDILHQARKLQNINTGKMEMEVRGVPAERMRYADFAAWAEWCNREGHELRVNLEINASGEMLDVVNQKVAPIGHGMVVRFGTKYGCIFDHTQEPVQMFGMGNIIAGSFSEEFLKVSDRANSVEVTFMNANADYERDVLTIYGDTYDSDGYAKTAQITMDGITSYEQAYREGMYQLMCNKYQLRTVSFEADIDSIACTMGDCVLVSHDVPKWANSGRIESVSGKLIRLPIYVSDRKKSYRLQYRTRKDAMYTYPCEIQSSSEDGWTTVLLSTDYNKTDPPQSGDIFDLAVANIGSKPFVIKNITRTQEFRRRITAIEYAESLYDESYEIPPIQYAERAVTTAKNVSNLSASQRQYTDAYRVRRGIMSVSWKQPSNGGKFTVLTSTDNNNWTVQISGIGNNYAEFEVAAKTTYYVKVITVLGVTQSSGVVIGPVEPGQDEKPAAVTGVSYKIDPADRTKAELTWDPNNELDFNHYEVTVNGKTYNTAANILTIVSDTNMPMVRITVVDNAQNKSDTVSIMVPIYTYPSNVAGLAVHPQDTDRSILELSWNAVPDSDLSQYELRVGSTWNDGELIGKTKTLKTTYKVGASGNYRFWIAAINAAGNYSQIPSSIARQVNIVPGAVTNLAVTQNQKDRSKAIIQYGPSPGEDIAKYVIKYGNVWSNGTIIVETNETRVEWQVPRSGTYNVMVQATTVAGQTSSVANARITIAVEPSDVMNLTAAQSSSNKKRILLSWETVDEADIAFYEIRQGETWETATVVAPRVNGTSYEVIIAEEELFTWMVKATTIAGNQSQYAARVQAIFNLNPTPVETIQLRQNPNDRSQLNIQWSAVPDEDIVGYQVKIGDKWDSAEEIPLTNELYASYILTATGNYNVMIKTINTAGFYSDERSASLRCTVEPTNATDFVVYQNGEEIELYWNKSSDTDVVKYEIREGSSWETGVLVSAGVTDNFYKYNVDVEREYQYHIKAINRAGFFSELPKTASINVENLPLKNVILSFDEIANPRGTHNNTVFGVSELNFQTVGGRFSDYPTTRFSELGGRNVLKLVQNSGTYATNGTYLIDAIDVGSVITAGLSVYFVSTAIYTGDTSASLQYRTSIEGTVWTDWITFRPAQKRFRYVQFRVLLATQDTKKTPEVNHILVKIDVPDTDIALTAFVAQGGSTLQYGHEFYTTPNVTAQAIGNNVHAVVLSRDETQCVVQVLDNSNNDVGGTVDIKIKGY